MNDLCLVASRDETTPSSSNLSDEALFAQLGRRCLILRCACPKIQRVAHHLRNRKAFTHYYSPRMLSLGPIYHGEPHLKLGEQYKLMWASMYVRHDRDRAQYLHRKIVKHMEELKNRYDEDVIRHLNDQQLAQMLFLDGCALLHVLKNPDILEPQQLAAKVDQLALVRQDVLLLENQLPFLVLEILSDVCDTELLKHVDDFLSCHHFSREKPGQSRAQGDSQHQHVIDNLPAHLLDRLRSKVLAGFSSSGQEKNQIMMKGGTITYRNLKELKAAGIQVKRSDSECPIDITFSSCCLSGELKLPEIVVDDTTAPTYLNLMAYEACPDFDNNFQISSYVEFMDSLIDQPEDVGELRRARVMLNALGSDYKVAELFNNISIDVVPNAKIYGPLREEIEKHYKQKLKTWYALAKDRYFSNPWSITAVIAASAILLLTFVQTWFAAFPRRQ